LSCSEWLHRNCVDREQLKIRAAKSGAPEKNERILAGSEFADLKIERTSMVDFQARVPLSKGLGNNEKDLKLGARPLVG
jgi:hypothetical protein